jgi:hypothetical protein
MEDLHEWITKNIKQCQPRKEHALRALRHLSKLERKNLFSDEISFMRSAEGRWFEMITYELFLDIAKNTDAIKKVVLKGADIKGKKPSPAAGQNGFFYSRNGDITIRGNGQDLAEFDLVMTKQDGSVLFVEVVTSPSDLKDFLQEIYYKKQVIRYLFNQKAVTFILVTSFPLANYKGGRKVLGSEEHISICTRSCENFRKHITGAWNPITLRPILPDGKTCLSTDLALAAPFPYKEFHDQEKDWVFTHLGEEGEKPDLPSNYKTHTLVKKIIFGRLFPSTARRLCEKYQFVYKDKGISADDLQKQYSRIILAADLPDYGPLIYLKPRLKKEYYKMVYDGHGTFKYERKTPPKVGFYLWLESLEQELGSQITIRLVDSLSTYCFTAPAKQPPGS